MMRALVTGADGFVGQHLLQLLLKNGYSVAGTFYSHQPQLTGIEWLQCNVREREEVDNLVRRVQPDHIYHLAALSSPTGSFTAERLVYDTNFWGTLNLLEAIRKFAPQSRVLYVGSAQCYGKPNELPVTESHELKPQSPYAVSKAAADLLCYQYFCTHRLHIVRARPFNHTGPGQEASFVCSGFAKQVAAIELGLQEPTISVGNLDVARDFSDVRDVVSAYEMLLKSGVPGEAYNIGSGAAIGLISIIDIFLSFSSRKIEIRRDPRRIRAAEPARVYGSVDKLKQTTGWKQCIALEVTLRNLYESWYEDLRKVHCDNMSLKQ
jgi:GDP-4-dehydro-6-deoxy-D-mannose reductase